MMTKTKMHSPLTLVDSLMKQASDAQELYRTASQEKVDYVVGKAAEKLTSHSMHLAKLAQKETGFGNAEDKNIKNLFASEILYNSIKDMPTVGIVEEIPEKKMLKIVAPLGVLVALIPSTNPTSTTIFKVLLALKTKNAIILSPHPRALQAIKETVSLFKEVLQACGLPIDLVQLLEEPTIEDTQKLMAHPDTDLILATGGKAMVRIAYSSGNPAIGVGPGNTPALLEKSADIAKAVDQIIRSKTFDYGTICASEQALVVEQSIKDAVISELKANHGYFLNQEESERLADFITTAEGGLNPRIIGQPAVKIAEMSGLSVPSDTKILVSEQTVIAKDNPYAREKLSPILAFYTVADAEEGIRFCQELLKIQGAGHTAVVHTKDDTFVREFGLAIPSARILVNTQAALGAIGGTTNLNPSLTLGCGSHGGGSTSENIHVAQLLYTHYIAYDVEK